MENIQSQSSEKIQTTLGDLIVAISDIALKAVKSESEGYELASLTLQSILKKNNKTLNAVI